jgi:hypothetical protein
MLQAVVANDDVATSLRQCACGRDTVAIHPHRHLRARGDQQGFVTALIRRRGRINPARRRVLAPVAATGHTGFPARRTRRCTSAMVMGVLPLPPAVRLPTTTTGTPAARARNRRWRYIQRRNAVTPA